MASITNISCWQGISNFFAYAQHKLHEDFMFIENPMGIWGDYVTYTDPFPNGSGAAARTTLMGSRRPSSTQTWNRMVGLQPDCLSSCEPATTQLKMNSWEDKWYYLFENSFQSEVFCLTEMWLNALNLPRQVENIIRNLKNWNDEVLDDWYRMTYIALCQKKWLGVDNNVGYVRKGLWDFAHDANGDPNPNYIVLDPSVSPTQISLLTQDMLDFIGLNAFYTKAWNYRDSTLKPLFIDSVTSLKLPQQDNNRRQDNRYIDHDSLDPRLGYERSYAGWGHKIDDFIFRYNWTLTDPLYPNGVLKRVYHFADQPITAGCTSDVNPDYLAASFAIFLPYNDKVVEYQNMEFSTTVGKDARFQAYTYQYEGIWKWFNQVDEYTPQNARKEKGYWMADFRKAPKPNRYDLGHAILARLYDTPGVLASCRPLSISLGSYAPCNFSCPPFDFFPPAMVVRNVCGGFSVGGVPCQPANQGSAICQ